MKRRAPDHDDRDDIDESLVSRRFHIERRDVPGEDAGETKTVYRVSLSSESPIQDYPWMPPTRLVHTRDAVDLDGVSDRGLAVLDRHADPFGGGDVRCVVGRVVNLKLEKRRLVGELKFSEANPEAAIVRGMVDEGTLTDMSIEAQRVKWVKRESADGGVERVDWTRWRPVRVAIVDAGADRSVGIGRRDGHTRAGDGTLAPTGAHATRGTRTMARRKGEEDREDLDLETEETEERTDDAEAQAQARVERAAQSSRSDFAAESEKKRKAAIRNLAKTNNVDQSIADEWITRGYSLDQVADDLVKIHEERGKESPSSVSRLDLSKKELRQYSLARAIVAAHSGSWKDAGLELECTTEIQERLNKVPERGGFYVPLDVQRRQSPVPTDYVLQRMGVPQSGPGAAQARMLAEQLLARDLTVASGGGGGFTVQTSVLGFDELLRNISFAFRMGVRRLGGLRDSITIPRQSAAATAEWLTSESDTPTESQQTFVQLSLSPKTISAYTEMSRQLLLQSTLDIEGFVNADLAAAAALGVDAAVLSGSGAAGQPEGLDNVTGVGSVSGTSLAYADILEFQSDVATANVMPLAGGYVTTPAVASLMMQRVKFTSTASPLWEGNLWTGSMAGFPAMSTNQVAAATMYFGDWAKALVAEWGVLEVETNPYANFPAGIIAVRVMYSIDVGIRYPAAFSIASSIT